MDNIKSISKIIIISMSFSFFFIIFLVLIVQNSSGGDSSIRVVNYFKKPFEDSTIFAISSEYGYREDPLNEGNNEFHKGIDLSANEGTDVLASADGTVIETGFEEDGFGNYVYIEHYFDGDTFYSIYGHMMDDTIVVSIGEKVNQGDRIGCVGNTGASTGAHLHFALLMDQLSFEEKYLIDPTNIINGLS